MSETAPLIAHIIHRLDYGGLENGLVNLINHPPPERYRHAIICLTDYNPEFRRRIQRADVEVFALNKRDGHDLGLYGRLKGAAASITPSDRAYAAWRWKCRPALLAGVQCTVSMAGIVIWRRFQRGIIACGASCVRCWAFHRPVRRDRTPSARTGEGGAGADQPDSQWCG